METREISIQNWKTFFEEFSRLHYRKQATVSTMASDLGVQSNAINLALTGITAECGSDGKTWRIEVMLGTSPDAHLEHTIDRPSHVRVAEWNDAYSAALQIETEGGSVTLVRVGPEAEVLPEGVVMDGVPQRP